MQLSQVWGNRGLIDEIDQRRRVIDDDLRLFLTALQHPNGYAVDPLREVIGRLFGVKARLIDAVGEALHADGAALEVGQHRIGHAAVVVGQPPFGQANVGEEYLAGVANLERAAIEVERARAHLAPSFGSLILIINQRGSSSSSVVTRISA